MTDDAVSAPPPLGVPLGGEQRDGVPAHQALDSDQPVVGLDGFDGDQRHPHTSRRTAVSPGAEEVSRRQVVEDVVAELYPDDEYPTGLGAAIEEALARHGYAIVDLRSVLR